MARRRSAVRLPFTPRLLPVAMLAMLALAGVKSAGLVNQALVSQALAENSPPTAKPAPPIRQRSAAVAAAPAPILSADQQPQVITPPAPAPLAEPPVSDAERGILLDLRRRRGELETRAAALAVREGLLAATEKRLSDRANELADLQRRLEALETARTAHDEENWRGIVKVYETMKPRDAAAIFNDLDRPVLLAVLDRMKESKAAPVLAAMQPERARQITTDLARRRTQANRPADPAPPKTPG